jgi:hypothetical protein
MCHFCFSSDRQFTFFTDTFYLSVANVYFTSFQRAEIMNAEDTRHRSATNVLRYKLRY